MVTKARRRMRRKRTVNPNRTPHRPVQHAPLFRPDGESTDEVDQCYLI